MEREQLPAINYTGRKRSYPNCRAVLRAPDGADFGCAPSGLSGEAPKGRRFAPETPVFGPLRGLKGAKRRRAGDKLAKATLGGWRASLAITSFVFHIKRLRSAMTKYKILNKAPKAPLGVPEIEVTKQAVAYE